jgi:hypothetical protein
MSVLGSSVHGLWAETAAPYAKTLKRLLGDLEAMTGMIRNLITTGKPVEFSPGKNREVGYAN